MPENRILCIGLVCVDLIQICKDYPDEDSDQSSLDHRWQRGGNAANNCTILALCGQTCEFFGTMSDDLLGQFAKQDFQKHRIIIENVVTCKAHSCPFSSVLINAKNGSRTIIHSNKNMPEVKLEDFTKLDLKKYQWIHFEGRNVNQVILMLKHILQWNSSHSPISTSVELEKPRQELEDLLSLADVVFIGKDFAAFQGCRDKYEAVNKYVPRLKSGAAVVVAWGEAGAAAQRVGGEVVECAAIRVAKVEDTLAAGDTFVAATVLALSRAQSLEDSIRLGCSVAGAKVTAQGFSAVHPGLLQLH